MINIYTDGASRGNGKEHTKAGYAFVIVYENKEIYSHADGELDLTNQQAELKAVIDACKAGLIIKEKLESPMVTIYTDSAYIYNCYKESWWKNWEKHGWKNAKQKPVANQDLWEKIIPFFKSRYFDFVKVEGHSTNKWNNRADELATSAADDLK